MNAIQTIKATYDYDQCKEIVEHGCQSGVCSQHIYYGDTGKFFDRYENEVIHRLSDQLGDDTIEEIWNQNPGHIAGYKEKIVWSFIEMVAAGIVDAKEAQELEDDEVIGSYFNPQRSNADYSKEDLALLRKHGYNPQRSMSESRYAQV